REELLAEYRRRDAEFTTNETRELWMIEAPFERFLPSGGRWAVASMEDKSVAWLAAEKHIREVAEALALRPFESVAAEMSLGPHRGSGGLWGMIGKPLQAPYDAASGRIFQFKEQQFSEPIQTDVSWCIVRCGKINPATRTTFEQAQGELRTSLREERYNKLATDYVLGLADKATLVGFDSFVRAGVMRAAGDDWPARE
ncbi:MAG: peptidylprolyl isomerase, partial [Phycisphaerae bacterium]